MGVRMLRRGDWAHELAELMETELMELGEESGVPSSSIFCLNSGGTALIRPKA